MRIKLVSTVDVKKQNIRVLYIDDEEQNLVAFKANLRKIYEVFTAISAAEGRKILEKKKIHIILADQRMPKITGVDFFASIKNEFPDPIRMLITGYADISAVIDAINKGGVYSYITKPWNEEDLKVTIENAFEVYSLMEERKELIEGLKNANQQLEFMLRQHLIT